MSDVVDQTVDNTQDVLESDLADLDNVLDGAQHIVEGATDGVAGKLSPRMRSILEIKKLF